jgi:hypothetical protein
MRTGPSVHILARVALVFGWLTFVAGVMFARYLFSL